MKRNYIRFALVAFAFTTCNLVSISSRAQDKSEIEIMKGYLYLQPNIGVSQYFGDLNEKDLWNQNPKMAFGAIVGYQLSPVFGVRAQFDKLNLYSERTGQNKVLSSDLWDAALHLTVNINEIFAEYNRKRLINFYLFSGAGIANFKSNLKDIPTDLIVNEHTSWQHAFSLPVGAGASIRLNNALSINLEYTDHTIFNATKLDFTESGKTNNDHYSYASAGLQINVGVKDTDDDGVRDKDDLCPDAAGKYSLAGCPDKDNDGVADKDDACHDVAGKVEFKGCPDTDGDGIIDSEDLCPDAAGKKELNGCPDTDNDGIADKDDKCPDVAGKAELAGCPDRDGDGIADNDDACPDVKGLAQFKGCPDTDGDGIPDNLDKCPDVSGIAANNGCPEVVTGPLLEKTVYFKSDGDVVIDTHMTELKAVVAFMNEHPDAVVSVAGFADDRESAEYNLRLSEKRADFVIKYLKKNGHALAKIERSFFGKSKPVADNKTSAGRALNRRVEIRITK